MKRVNSVFLAGPDPWFPDADAYLHQRDERVRGAGLVPVRAPAGAMLEETRRTEVEARLIYADTMAALRTADALIANLTPWRGVSCDPATAFQAGVAAGLGKPVFAWMNVSDEDDAELRGRVEAMLGAVPGADGRWRDAEGCEIEDFFLPETLMLWGEARRLFVVVTPEPLADLTGLDMCLDSLQIYAE